MRQDVLFAIRQLLKAPSFAIAAVLTLALGIGTTAGVFSVVNAVVLRPLPFADAHRVVNLHPAREGVSLLGASNLELATWRALPRLFDGVVGVAPGVSLSLTRGDSPEVVSGARVTSEFSRVFGVSPVMGRGFSADDDQPGAPRVVIPSHALWSRAFNADRVALGAVVGIALTAATTPLLRDQLYDVAPGDVTTIATVTVLLLLVSLGAVCIPARRAMRISPARALAD